MKFLLKVAGDFVFRAAEKSGGAYREEASVHALNVLRMLSRDAALKYVVIPYLPEALMLAVEGYTSSRYLFEENICLIPFPPILSQLGNQKLCHYELQCDR